MIINKTRNQVISQQELVCATFFSRLRGLMFRQKQNAVLVLKREQTVSIHTFFVFYPLHLLMVSSRGKVLEIKENLRSWSVWTASAKGKYVVELSDFDSKKNIEVGDILILKN